jgi:hypothetical protein
MRLSPDQMIFWQHGFLKLNGTIVFTWGLMIVLAVGPKLITRNLSTELERTRWQNFFGNNRHRSTNRSKKSACGTRRNISVFSRAPSLSPSGSSAI